jgi:hypothetical protein
VRFQIARSKWFRWALVPFGATAARSYVELSGGELEVCFGFFRVRLPVATVRAVESFEAPKWLVSIGWRTDLHRSIALMGANTGLVRLDLKRRQWMSVVLPVNCDRLILALEDRTAFVEALRGELVCSN